MNRRVVALDLNPDSNLPSCTALEDPLLELLTVRVVPSETARPA